MSVTHTLSGHLTLIAENYGIVIPPEVSEMIIYYVYHRGEIIPRCELVSFCNSLYDKDYDVKVFQHMACQEARISSLKRAIRKHKLVDFDDSDPRGLEYEELLKLEKEDPKCYVLGKGIANPIYPYDDQENFDYKCVCIDLMRNLREYFEIRSIQTYPDYDRIFLSD